MHPWSLDIMLMLQLSLIELNISKSLPNIGMQWKKIRDAYYNSLLQNKTWQFMKLHIWRRAIGWKWVFKVWNWSLQNMIRGKKLFLSQRNWLWWNFCIGCKIFINLNVIGNRSYVEFWNPSNGCKINFSPWWSEGRYLHGVNRKLWGTW